MATYFRAVMTALSWQRGSGASWLNATQTQHAAKLIRKINQGARTLTPRIWVRILVPQPTTFFIRRNYSRLRIISLRVLVNNQIVAHPVEACWVNPIKKLGQGGMPWLKQLRDMSVTL